MCAYIYIYIYIYNIAILQQSSVHIPGGTLPSSAPSRRPGFASVYAYVCVYLYV